MRGRNVIACCAVYWQHWLESYGTLASETYMADMNNIYALCLAFQQWPFDMRETLAVTPAEMTACYTSVHSIPHNIGMPFYSNIHLSLASTPEPGCFLTSCPFISRLL